MDSKITVLDPHTANQIAAGEVVERPASVIKELIENSIDAGSTRIEIEITFGGLKTIKVTDNGEGMTPVDAELAFVRHATSKIKTAADLFLINTLGFRGEALPSIAAVSKIELLTRTTSRVEGTKLCIEAGKIISKEPCGCPVGTTVKVEDIFYNTPARQKYLKTALKEAATVADIVNRLALINPQIAFKLMSDGRLILQTNGNNNLLAVIAQVYNTELAKNLLPIKFVTTEVSITGFIGQNFQYRANRDLQNFFINKRYIHSLKLSKALEKAYEGKIPVKRYPVCVVNIEIASSLVDVNVHPAKMEVRFEKEESVLEIFTKLVQDTLHKETRLPDPKQKPVKYTPTWNQVSFNLPKRITEIIKESVLIDDSSSLTKDHEFLPVNKEVAEPKKPIDEIFINAGQPAVQPEPVISKPEQEKLPPLFVIGQLHDLYILAQGENGLYLIDQHAAHERIMYEELSLKFEMQGSLSSQTLALPLTLELSYPETVRLVENIFIFSSLGIIIEHFGGNTFLIRGLPLGFTLQEGEDLVNTLLTELTSKSEKQIVQQDFLKVLACKKAVKANKHLSTSEMDYLLQKLDATEFPFTCPHGRPTIIFFPLSDLAKRFLRT